MAVPPMTVYLAPATRSESSRASTSSVASAVRARTSTGPAPAAINALGNAGSTRSYAFRKCPELRMRPALSWSWSMASPELLMELAARSSSPRRAPGFP